MKIMLLLYLFLFGFTEGKIEVEENFRASPPIFHGDDIMDHVDFSNIVENDFVRKGIGGLTDLGKGNTLVNLVAPSYHFVDDFKAMKDDFLKSNALSGFSGVPPNAQIIFDEINYGLRPDLNIHGGFPHGYNEFNFHPQFQGYHGFNSPEYNLLHKPKELPIPIVEGIAGPGHIPKPHEMIFIPETAFPIKEVGGIRGLLKRLQGGLKKLPDRLKEIWKNRFSLTPPELEGLPIKPYEIQDPIKGLPIIPFDPKDPFLSQPGLIGEPGLQNPIPFFPPVAVPGIGIEGHGHVLKKPSHFPFKPLAHVPKIPILGHGPVIKHPKPFPLKPTPVVKHLKLPFKPPFAHIPKIPVLNEHGPIFHNPKAFPFNPHPAEFPGIPIDDHFHPAHKTDIKKAHLKAIKLGQPVHPSVLKTHVPLEKLPGISGVIPSAFNPLSPPFKGLESFAIFPQNNFNLLTKNLQFHNDLSSGLSDITEAHLKSFKFDEPFNPGLVQGPQLPNGIIGPGVILPDSFGPEHIGPGEIVDPSLIAAHGHPSPSIVPNEPYKSVNFSKEELDYTFLTRRSRSSKKKDPEHPKISITDNGSILRQADGGLVHEDLHYGDKLIST